jgi:hypothetical protein
MTKVSGSSTLSTSECTRSGLLPVFCGEWAGGRTESGRGGRTEDEREGGREMSDHVERDGVCRFFSFGAFTIGWRADVMACIAETSQMSWHVFLMCS